MATVTPEAQAYIDAVAAEHRPLYDRLHGLVLGVHPDVSVKISYQIPTYVVGKRRLYLAAWKHGVSIYGWHAGDEGGFLAAHPKLQHGRSTIRLTPEVAADIGDDEFLLLVRAALGG